MKKASDKEKEDFAISAFVPSDRTVFPERLKEVIDVKKFSLAAFKFLGPHDRVVCEHCGGKLHRWRKHDVPLYEHIKNFPHCPFVQKLQEQIGRTSRLCGIDATRKASHFETTLTKNGFNVMRSCVDFINGYKSSSLKCLTGTQVVQTTPNVDHSQDTSEAQQIYYSEDIVSDDEETVPIESRVVTPGEVTTRMHSSTAQYIIRELGFSPDCLYNVIHQRLRNHGDDFMNAESMMLAVIKWERLQQKKKIKELMGESSSEQVEPLEGLGGTTDHMQAGLQARADLSCMHCHDRTANTALFPCQHLVVCSQCAPIVQTCPDCNSPISSRLHTFIS